VFVPGVRAASAARDLLERQVRVARSELESVLWRSGHRALESRRHMPLESGALMVTGGVGVGVPTRNCVITRRSGLLLRRRPAGIR
jgi:hypothetical protein